VNLVLNWWLVGRMGFQGLALGTSIAATVNAGLLLAFLARRMDGIDGARTATALLKIALASVAMGAAAWAAERGLGALLPDTLLGTVEVERAVRVLGAVGAGMAVLALASWALRIEEFRQVIARVLTRINRRRALPPQ
jgi:putative peptidoglycan lipid II flippase